MVLVAEDEFRIREVLVDTLLDAGYDVVDAANGIEAIQKVKEYIPDVVLLDVMMPELDGFQVMEQMKANPETENIPVILLTAMPADQGESAAMEMGTLRRPQSKFNPRENPSQSASPVQKVRILPRIHGQE